jgi:hypothetical protein
MNNRPMAYQIEWQQSVVYVNWTGEVTVSDLGEAVREVSEHPDFDLQRFHVVDVTAATLPPLDMQVFDAIAPAIGATMTNRSITAIWVPDDPRTRAFVEFCSPMLVGLHSVRVLGDRAAADEWIREQASWRGGRR